MSKPIAQLPLVGTVHRDGVAYRAASPVPIHIVTGLIRESWCSRIAVTDASSDGQAPAEFHAMCVVEGEPFVLTGRIGERD
ncbi:hypothetical protein ACH4E7_43500 [Kitasatospora sp. NPDC018058]|uniref:hypothetical protein n=1 Tax=Kitasatospora sp. NPDC018058 TaxID=3364025 RepID=UPI0037BFD96D